MYNKTVGVNKKKKGVYLYQRKPIWMYVRLIHYKENLSVLTSNEKTYREKKEIVKYLC